MAEIVYRAFYQLNSCLFTWRQAGIALLQRRDSITPFQQQGGAGEAGTKGTGKNMLSWLDHAFFQRITDGNRNGAAEVLP